MIFIILWVISGILAYGISFAHWQRSFPLIAKESYIEDVILSISFGLFGIFSLMVLIILTNFVKHGIKFK